ncbi:GNAT family N-acetyltransferase [Streptomyces sp. NBC_00247]|uniref:GNAT family N-acetyltransferase n=1 Tax=Streptomyces sp. NBC_00247 TaxID=2975689 RepID=UPI002E2E31E1|nr:GNAT family N-acetyltransferase [Streptomyces sp. NBC_00247]
MNFVTDTPRVEDAPALAHTLLAAWLLTYPNQDAGIDEAWIRAQRGDVVTDEGIARWQGFIDEAQRRPAHRFCRVVREEGEIIGLLCGRRDDDGGAVSLGPMYLLPRAQGRSIGGELMVAFLTWAGSAPVRLWVTAYNDRAIDFYRRHGFEDTGERHLWRDKLPNLRMARPGPGEQREDRP